VSLVPLGRTLIPRYVAVGNDWIVGRFSATFAVPDNQRLEVPGGHSAIVKPPAGDTSLADWLIDRVVAVRDLRDQFRRDTIHAARTLTLKNAPPAPILVTEFWSDNQNPKWEGIYNAVREIASNDDIVIQDSRLAEGLPVDLLITVCEADGVVRRHAGHQERLVAAHTRRQAGVKTIGMSPVGATCASAELVLKEWLSELPDTSSFYVKGASDASALRELMTQWLSLTVERDPRRRTTRDVTTHLLDRVNPGASNERTFE